MYVLKEKFEYKQILLHYKFILNTIQKYYISDHFHAITKSALRQKHK